MKTKHIDQLAAEEASAKARLDSAKAAMDRTPDDASDAVLDPLREALASATREWRDASGALYAARNPIPAHIQREIAEANASQLAARERLAKRDARPVFAPRCGCGGTHGVSPDRQSCDDCRD